MIKNPSIEPQRTTKLARRERVAWLIVLAAVLIINFLDMPSVMWAGDPTMWREETRSIVFRQQLSVDPIATRPR
jgi:hypothetical protein